MKINLSKYAKISTQDVFNSVYSLPLKVQFCHHNTLSYAQHKALDEAYEALNDFKDEIVEQMIGYGVARPSKIEVGIIEGFTPDLPLQIAKEIMYFGKSLQAYAESAMPNIENLAQEYSGAGAKLNYLLSLK